MSGMSLWSQAIPSWVAAVGTVSTSALAVTLAIVERNRARRAEAERDELREAREAGVASRVAGWLERTPEEPRERYMVQLDRQESWRASVRNASDQVVTEVHAYAIHGDGGEVTRMARWALVPPLETVHEDRIGVLHSYNEKPFLRVIFTDPSGRRWVRGEGQPRIATPEDEWVTPY